MFSNKLVLLNIIRRAQTFSLSETSKPLKSYDDIPGPKKRPIVGNLLELKAFGGEFDYSEFPEFCAKLHQKYGDIVRFELFNNKQIFLFNPEHVKRIYQIDNDSPIRPPATPWKKYYELRNIPQTLVNSQGNQWRKLRTASNPIAARPKTVYSFLPKHNEVVDELVKIINKKFNGQPNIQLNGFEDTLKLAALEMVSVVAFDQRLQCIDENNRTPFVDKVVSAIDDFFTYTGKLIFSVPIWMYYPTQDWKKFVSAADFVYDTVRKYVNAGLEDLNKRGDDFKADLTSKSILQNFLLTREKYGLSMDDVMALTSDFLIAGVDTTSAALSFILYELGTRENLQDALYDELNRNLKKNEEVTEEKLAKLPFLKAVLKETLRLHPIAPGNSRVVQHDIQINDYLIPKGTCTVMATTTISRSEKNFKNADDFNPYRWIKGETEEQINPYSHLPFGFGARQCIGRRIAEQEIFILTIKLLQNFKVKYLGEKPGYRTRLVSTFDRPLNIMLSKRV